MPIVRQWSYRTIKFTLQQTEEQHMLKKLLTLLTAIAITGLSMQSLAAKGGEKGPSDRAYERASDNASFKRDRDDDDDGKKKHKKKDKAKDRDDDDDDDRDRDRDRERDRDRDDDDDRGDKDRDKKKQRDRSGESDSDVKSDRKKSGKQK
jgi:hypothetical protein